MKQMDQLAVALRPAGDDGNHGNPQRSGKGGNVDFQTAFFGDIHHVQAQNERHPHFEELNGKVEISFEIGSIHDVDQQVRIFVDQVCDRQLLLQRLGGQAVNAGKVLKDGFWEGFDPAPFFPPSPPASFRRAAAFRLNG